MLSRRRLRACSCDEVQRQLRGSSAHRPLSAFDWRWGCTLRRLQVMALAWHESSVSQVTHALELSPWVAGCTYVGGGRLRDERKPCACGVQPVEGRRHSAGALSARGNLMGARVSQKR